MWLIITAVLFSTPKVYALPAQPFLWGVANASFQVEGSPADSDWYRFTHRARKIKDRTNADQATDFWNRYHEDFLLAKQLGVNSFRLSIAWERIQPEKDCFDETALEHYVSMMKDLRTLGIEPIITLQHYVLPAWLADEGGLLAEKFPEYFTAYAEKVISRLRQNPTQVSYWITFNEPELWVMASYLQGKWPPNHFLRPKQAVKAAAAIARAHIQLVNRIRALQFQEAKISVAKHWSVIQAFSSKNKDQKTARWVDDLFNRQFMDAFLDGNIRFKLPGTKALHEKINIKGAGKRGLDFISVNYYQRALIKRTFFYPNFGTRKGPGPTNDLGWEIYPEGMYLALKDIQKYGLPILISENGTADKNDSHRSEFLKNHIQQLQKAKDEGVNLMGYLHWSLTDNFEWAEGLTPRFGLVEIDYSTQKRTPRPSFFVYQKIIAESEKLKSF